MYKIVNFKYIKVLLFIDSMKKYSLLLFIILLSSFCFAESITDYKITNEVNLDQQVTATGLYSSDTNTDAGVLCSFYFFDATTGALVNRATDQYTTQTGRFTMPSFPIREPGFKRGSDYTLTSECGGVAVDSNFSVIQRETISHSANQEFEYLTSPENTESITIWGIMVAFIAILILPILGFGYLLWRKR